MPHIAVTMYPGRDDRIKKELAEALQNAAAERLGIDKGFVSVSIEDIQKDKWSENLKKFPEEIMFAPPEG